MKRLTLALVALSFLAAPAAYADTWRPHQNRYEMNPHVTVHTERDRARYAKPHWQVGKRVPAWQRKAVRDYHRFGLHRPGRGQQWVRIGNDFLLVKITSGSVIRIIVR